MNYNKIKKVHRIFLCLFLYVNCVSITEENKFFIRLNSTKPGQFGIYNYQVLDDIFYYNSNSYLSGENKLFYKKIDEDQKGKLKAILDKIAEQGNYVDSSLYHPAYYIELFTDEEFKKPKQTIFNDKLPKEMDSLITILNYFADDVKIKEVTQSYSGIKDLNLTYKINSNPKDTIELQSYEAFNIWRKLMLANFEEPKNVYDLDGLTEVGFIYPIDYNSERISRIFIKSSEEYIVFYENGSVVELRE